ncbi:transcriptional regulator [Aliidongia dinghuensis]|uniref:Transcriptional regulator n=1 Tax=Aliidongia dinghuensis TaxID=1867774 RepID=A0A8J3E257_9PROT|nr:cupin domain-containing protein [Aliidongia dinghuensis]GGF18159.1 transcriptional regulator [Aliidongia dinghuensis]
MSDMGSIGEAADGAATRDEAPAPTSPLDSSVGLRLRALRKQHRLSLQVLAGRLGVSIGHLSQIERGLSTASLKLLAGAADAFGVGLADLFPGAAPAAAATEPETSTIVVRQSERGRLGLWQAGITKELLTAPRGASRLNLFMVRIEPGGTTGEEDYVHGGEEAGFVLEGALELHVEGREWRLEPGDSFRFASDRPHRFGNPTDEVALVLWVNVTP